MCSDYDQKSKLRQRLKFRRQFLIGPDIYSPNRYWNKLKLKHGLVLSIHKDLHFYHKENSDRMIILIGIAVDCTNPFKTNSNITSEILTEFDSIQSVIDASKSLAGRWVLICQNARNTFIFNDPCGLRQVFYHFDEGESWCASEPTLINQAKPLSRSSDKSILRFKNSTRFINKESAWIGDKTLYESCYKLMPNHYLDLNISNQIRFFPKTTLPASNHADKLARKAALLLKNIVEGLEHKFKINISLTAGFDSRLLLAASKKISDKITYSTNPIMPISIYPKSLSNGLT